MLTPQDLRHRLIRATAARKRHHTGIPRFVKELLQKDAHRYQYTATPQNPPSFTYGADFETRYSSPINRKNYPQTPNDRYPNQKSDDSGFFSKIFSKKILTDNRSGSKKQTTKPPPPSDIMRLFAETSLPGFRDIALSRSYLRRIFWILAFFFFSIWALRDISQLVNEYYDYPITVKVRSRENRQIEFPSVTVCNLNIVRFSALCLKNISKIYYGMIPDDLRIKLCGTAPPVVKSLINYTIPSTFSPEPPSIGARKKKKTSQNGQPVASETFPEDINNYGDRASCNCTDNATATHALHKRQVMESTAFGHILNAFGIINETNNVPDANEQLEITEREEKELQENLTNWLAVIQHSNPPVARHLGHQFDDFLLHCTFRFTNCTDAARFEHIFTPTEGNCFTFKPTFNPTNHRRSHRSQRASTATSIAGNRYGLEMVLNFEIDEYLTGSTQIGAMVIVQHPDEIGLSASEAIFVEPQQSTYIGLRMNNITRLPAPFPDECVDQWPDAVVGRLTRNTSYSQQSCLKICLQKAIFLHCSCQSAMLPLLELESALKICDTRHRRIRDCVDNILYLAEERFGTCQCPARCQVINYDKTVSTTRWPTREDKITFDRKRSVSFQNLAKVTIYFQTMTCQEIVQERAYTTARLFSALGGILGMYVGFSFLSVLEILEVLFRRVWYAINHRNSDTENQEQQQHQQQQYDPNFRSAYYQQQTNRYNKTSFKSIVDSVMERLRKSRRNIPNGGRF